MYNYDVYIIIIHYTIKIFKVFVLPGFANKNAHADDTEKWIFTDETNYNKT
jgi:hypothetical protein